MSQRDGDDVACRSFEDVRIHLGRTGDGPGHIVAQVQEDDRFHFKGYPRLSRVHTTLGEVGIAGRGDIEDAVCKEDRIGYSCSLTNQSRRFVIRRIQIIDREGALRKVEEGISGGARARLVVEQRLGLADAPAVVEGAVERLEGNP